jgi:hypothetical protein
MKPMRAGLVRRDREAAFHARAVRAGRIGNIHFPEVRAFSAAALIDALSRFAASRVVIQVISFRLHP